MSTIHPWSSGSSKKGLGTGPSGLSFALCNTHSLSLRLQLIPFHLCLLFLVVTPWYLYLQNVRILCYNPDELLPMPSHRLSSWCLNFSAWPPQSCSFNCHSACPFSNGSSWPLTVQSLSDVPTPSYLQNQTLILPSSGAIVMYNFGHPWNSASVWSLVTLSRRSHLNVSCLFLIIANFSAPADHHQIFQQSKGFTLVFPISC